MAFTCAVERMGVTKSQLVQCIEVLKWHVAYTLKNIISAGEERAAVLAVD